MTNNPKPGLDPNKIGVFVRCVTCGLMKKPVGRSAGLMAHYCDDDCAGYRDKPLPGSLWPGETEAEFGFPVGDPGTQVSESLASARLKIILDHETGGRGGSNAGKTGC